MNLQKVNQIIESTIQGITEYSDSKTASYDTFMWNLYHSKDAEKLSFKEFKELIKISLNHKRIIKNV